MDEKDFCKELAALILKYDPHCHDADRLAVRMMDGADEDTLETHSVRGNLPARCGGQTIRFTMGGTHRFVLRTGHYADGTLGEIHLDGVAMPIEARAGFHAFSDAVSLALQNGVPLEIFVDTYVGAHGAFAGIVEGDEQIVRATSLTDYVFRRLAVDYLGQEALIAMQPLPPEVDDDMLPESPTTVAPRPSRPAHAADLGQGRPVFRVIEGDKPAPGKA